MKQWIEKTKDLILRRNPKAKVLNESIDQTRELILATQSIEIAENQFLLQRLYGKGNRVYRLISIFKLGENIGFVNAAFDTFKVISQTEVETELKKKYEEMKPPVLPQIPIISKLKSDAEDEGIKGQVKQVVIESEDLSGTWSVQGRKKSWIMYFNEQGFFVQKDLYDYKGFPSSIWIYGYIDGKRVSNDKSTKYDDNPPIMALPPLSRKQNESVKPDNRFQASYEFRYQDGKLIEKINRRNTGKIWMRFEYKYSENKVEELIYSEDGKINQHYVIKLDEKGNQIEKTDKDVLKIYGERKYRYEYEFDKQGNWIKQIIYKEETENGVKLFKPYSVYYRTITYW